MYGYPLKSFGLLKILTGLSRTLNLANNILPIYKKAKPTIDNAKNIISSIKKINLNSTSNVVNKEKKIIRKTSNNPTFFI